MAGEGVSIEGTRSYGIGLACAALAILAQTIAANQRDQYQLADIPGRYLGQMGKPSS